MGLLKTVIKRQAELVAHWMSFGFIHGVMNTDNTSISGETLDYGPCAFMDTYKKDQFFSFIDKRGRYRYSSQPYIAQWNISRFAESIAELLRFSADESYQALAERLGEVLGEFPKLYEAAWLKRFSAKLGIGEPSKQGKLEEANKAQAPSKSKSKSKSKKLSIRFVVLSHTDPARAFNLY